MSGDWLPVLVVLGVGALAGLLAAWRFGLSGSSSAPSETADEELRLADLEQRRDDLYERLRASDNEADRRVLEEQAARVLREIDEIRGALPASLKAKKDMKRASSEQPAAAAAAGSKGGRPMLVGFLGGAAMIGLVAVLVFLAQRDAKPDPSAMGSPPASAQGGDHPPVPLPPEVEARLASLRQQVEADPTDLVARKQLALALLASEQYFEAFQIAETILAGRPEDPDGLYVRGMVRMTMGQDDLAMSDLDGVLEQYPNHILALAGRGMVFMQRGDREAAVLVWERALEAAGGSHPDLEQLLVLARDPDHPPIGAPASGQAPAPPGSATPAPASSPSAAQPAPQVASDSFGVRIELAPGLTPPRGATLFVFLRESEQGPPSAVRRVHDPVFPLDVALGPDDSMMGRPLPDAGTLTVRLDADGSASTTGENDLAAEVAARAGASVRVVLGG